MNNAAQPDTILFPAEHFYLFVSKKTLQFAHYQNLLYKESIILDKRKPL